MHQPVCTQRNNTLVGQTQIMCKFAAEIPALPSEQEANDNAVPND